MSKIRRRRIVIASAAVYAVLLLGIAELVLRWTLPVYTAGIQTAYQYDRELGVRLRDSIRLFRVTDHREEIFSNLLGTANPQPDFSEYRKLLFALGDSYTQGTGLPADQSYPMQLDLLLNRDRAGMYQKDYGVVNLGLAAYGGEQSLLVLERFASRLGSPVACLYLGSDNDDDDDLIFRNGDRHRHVVKGNPKWGPAVPILIWLGNRQLVLRVKLIMASRRLDALRRESPERAPIPVQAPTDRTRDPIAMQSPVARERVMTSRSVAELQWPVIGKIVNSCQARGAMVVLAWSGLPGTSGSYEWLRDRAAASSIAFNDWYPRVASVNRAIPALPITNSHSGGHYRGWVAGSIADGFAATIMMSRAAAHAGSDGSEGFSPVR